MKNITIVSKENCTECDRIKNMMKVKGVEYLEQKMEDLPVARQFEIRNIARKNRHMSMPLMFISDEFVSTKEFESEYLHN